MYAGRDKIGKKLLTNRGFKRRFPIKKPAASLKYWNNTPHARLHLTAGGAHAVVRFFSCCTHPVRYIVVIVAGCHRMFEQKYEAGNLVCNTFKRRASGACAERVVAGTVVGCSHCDAAGSRTRFPPQSRQGSCEGATRLAYTISRARSCSTRLARLRAGTCRNMLRDSRWLYLHGITDPGTR